MATSILRLRREVYSLPTKLLQMSVVSSPIFSVARTITTCPVHCAGQRWREKQNLPPCGNETGPLTDWPDWSYADGRRAPIQSRQKKRLMKQREYAERIMQLTKEIDLAVEDHKRSQDEAAAQRQRLLDGKLKEKGEKLRSNSHKK